MFEEIPEFLFYILLFLASSFTLGVILEKIFPRETVKTLKDYETCKLIVLFMLRISIMSLIIFYIYKLLYTRVNGNSQAYEISETIVLTFALYNTQPSLVLMFNELARRAEQKV